jgi:inhibitor of cysteine peptidase
MGMVILAVLATIAIGAGDNGRTVAVPPSAQVVLTLASNPSTGFGWRVGPGSKVTVVSHRYVPPAHQIPGRGGKEVWRLRGPASGEATLSLVYARPSEPKNVARRFRVTLRVR